MSDYICSSAGCWMSRMSPGLITNREKDEKGLLTMSIDKSDTYPGRPCGKTLVHCQLSIVG